MAGMNHDGSPGLEFGDGNTNLDPSVVAKLPKGCRVVSTQKHGTSFWASSGRIDVQLEDGSPETFFIKVVSSQVGRRMVESEYESMTAIHGLLPDFAPEPIAWGTFEINRDAHFFLCEFKAMSGELPDPSQFAARLADMHQQSKSPNGKFGFHVITYSGNLSQENEWEDSWQKYFAKGLQHALDHELAVQGPSEEINKLALTIFEKVIPRLLGPLESEGRSVKPSLVHGDLWYGNTAIDAFTDQCFVFDACCFYAHNEYELGQWRPVCNKFGPEYVKAYHSFVPVSPPEEDYEGRLELYKLRFNTHVSALFAPNPNLRAQMIGDMRDLVKRFG
ncbi:Fructosamine kinase-domain-containing protein [Podospora didyma]|uniref:protein-ribulosamine 3-kinase n=1 Tax=Podospora didyma TaxID=330526 RepID=A0AAE0K2A0_9PEZI|nr:Fructosamine kinase-domain-containing protein [Podospora didyma]